MTESELLFTELLDCSRDELYIDKQPKLSRRQGRFLANALKRRLQGEPLQYILGRWEFMGYEVRLTRDVFIPRPETEILVGAALRLMQEARSRRQEIEILDIGTGSGCIAISLARLLPGAKITAVDISEKALQVARQNALLNKVNIDFLQSDLFMAYDLRLTTYDLIISNPPYIPAGELDNLEPELSYEPRIAVEAGRDGLDFYRRIIQAAPAYLKQGGFLIMEMGFNQCKAIKDLFNSCGRFEAIEISKDYSSIDRVIVAQLKKPETFAEGEFAYGESNQ
jgi:release factor glutamine methyltransferase